MFFNWIIINFKSVIINPLKSKEMLIDVIKKLRKDQLEELVLDLLEEKYQSEMVDTEMGWLTIAECAEKKLKAQNAAFVDEGQYDYQTIEEWKLDQIKMYAPQLKIFQPV